MADTSTPKDDSLKKLLKDECQLDLNKATDQKIVALKALSTGTIRVERFMWAFACVSFMVFAFAWGLFHATPDTKAMLFCTVLMLWALAMLVLYVLVYAIAVNRASIVREIKLLRLEQEGGASEPDAVDFGGRDLSLRTSRAERWAWLLVTLVMAVISAVIGLITTITW